MYMCKHFPIGLQIYIYIFKKENEQSCTRGLINSESRVVGENPA